MYKVLLLHSTIEFYQLGIRPRIAFLSVAWHLCPSPPRLNRVIGARHCHEMEIFYILLDGVDSNRRSFVVDFQNQKSVSWGWWAVRKECSESSCNFCFYSVFYLSYQLSSPRIIDSYCNIKNHRLKEDTRLLYIYINIKAD